MTSLRKSLFGLGFAAACFFCFVIWTVANAEFTYRHPRASDVKLTVTRHGVLRAGEQPSGARSDSKRNFAKDRPIAVIATTVHDFGVMDPLTMGRHEFVVRNEGLSPLELAVVSTTCKCTVGGVAQKLVPPGKETTISLEWNSGRELAYTQSALVRSNDPHKADFQLTIRGKVRRQFGADVSEVLVPNIEPDRSAKAEVLLYSQVWDQFEIADVQTKLPGLQWKLTPVDATAPTDLDARSIQRLTLTIPGDLPQGDFSDTIRMRVIPGNGTGDAQTFELPLHGKVMRRLAVYGPAITDQGIVNLGTVSRGVSKRIKLLLKVRDRDRSLPIERIEVTPGFLKAHVTPHDDKSSENGLYDLVVEIPTDAGPCQLLGNRMGQIRLITSHPRIGEVALGARLAVMSDP